jgi:hypothetical protein
MTTRPRLYGLMAEYEKPEQVRTAVQMAWKAGYRQMDAFTPYPVEGLAHELGEKKTRIPFIILIGGLTGAGVGFLMQYWSMAVDYPFNSGGRPTNSWPVFIPVTFEMMVLVASFGAFLGMLFLNGLPRPNHPVFNVPQFARASQDRFFLCIESADPQFDEMATAAFLAATEPPGGVVEVPFEVRPPAHEEQPAKPAKREFVKA